jgi:hypothetical protein
MINKIFWDIDETMIHTLMNDPKQNHVQFSLGDSFTYHTIIRPCSHELIRFSRELVGKENVHILTTATRDYAEKVNELAGWGFDPKDIFAREDQAAARVWVATAYGGGYGEITPHEYADPNNVLIDNLPSRQNQGKIQFIGIVDTHKTNYLKIQDYYGVDFPEDPFEEEVKGFLSERHQNKN